MKTRALALFALLPLIGLSGPSDKLRDRLSEIMIPVIDMENATVEEVLNFLRKQAEDRDLDGVGINIFVKATRDRLDSTVTVGFRNIPLKDALDTICSGARLHYKVEDHAVIIFDKTAASQAEVLETRMFPVKGTFRELMKPKK